MRFGILHLCPCDTPPSYSATEDYTWFNLHKLEAISNQQGLAIVYELDFYLVFMHVV